MFEGAGIGRQDHSRRGLARGLAPRHQVVEDRRHQQADDPGDIHAAEVLDHRSGVQRGRQERHLHQHAEGIDGDSRQVPATVAAVGVGQRGHVIALAGDEVVVDQVHRAPRGEEGQQEQDEGLERSEERVLAEQRDERRGADDREDEEQALHAGDLQLAAYAADDGRDAHEAAVGVQRGNGHLAEGDAEVEQRGDGPAAAQADDVGHLAAGELAVGQGCGEHPEDHRGLGAEHRAEADGEEGLPRRGGRRQVA